MLNPDRVYVQFACCRQFVHEGFQLGLIFFRKVLTRVRSPLFAFFYQTICKFCSGPTIGASLSMRRVHYIETFITFNLVLVLADVQVIPYYVQVLQIRLWALGPWGSGDITAGGGGQSITLSFNSRPHIICIWHHNTYAHERRHSFMHKLPPHRPYTQSIR